MPSGYSLWQIRREKAFSVRITGEPLDTETVTSGSEGGCWKSTFSNEGNSLAAYPTACTVLRGRGGGNAIHATRRGTLYLGSGQTVFVMLGSVAFTLPGREFAMYQESVMTPTGGWRHTRLKSLRKADQV